MAELFALLPAMTAEVLVIGAGLSGLICAQQLRQAGVNATLVEKSVGVGGRMATRRIHGIWVDHGAQYITVKSDAFERFIYRLQEKGIVQQWTRRVHQKTPQGILAPPPEDLYPRYACPKGMTAIAKYLASGQTILHNTRIITATVQDGTWQLLTDQRHLLTARVVVSTIPAPQMLPVFENALPVQSPFMQAVQSVRFLPNVTVMAGYPLGYEIPPEWYALRITGYPTVSWVSYDSSKHLDTATNPVFVFQSTAEYAFESLNETNLEHIGKTVLCQAGRILEPWLASPEWWQVHRWRYALVAEPLGVSCLRTATPVPLVCAGDWCAGANIESAYQSGCAAAEAALDYLH
jgi:predicted NAD/FAD-dependent oxidoreductase